VLDADKLVVACGENALAIMQLQRAGGKRLSAADFLRGRALAAHARFG
jgi:methionyl-tRNA formyltransferase